MDIRALKLGFIPGTGNMGFALAKNHAKAGFQVFIGSRDIEKAKRAVGEIKTLIGDNAQITPGTNKEVAAKSDIIFWAIQGPLEERHAQLASLKNELKNKIIIDVTNILYLFREEKYWGQISSVEQNIAALGVPAQWTFAYKSTFAKNLNSNIDESGAKRVICIGGDEPAVSTLKRLVEATGYETLNLGELKYAKIAELFGPIYLSEVDRLNGGKRGYWYYGDSRKN